MALDFAIGPSREIVIAGEKEDTEAKEMIREIYSLFLPNKVVGLHPSGEDGKRIRALSPFMENQKSIDGKSTAYVCKNYVCDFPTTDIAKLKQLLEK